MSEHVLLERVAARVFFLRESPAQRFGPRGRQYREAEVSDEQNQNNIAPVVSSSDGLRNPRPKERSNGSNHTPGCDTMALEQGFPFGYFEIDSA